MLVKLFKDLSSKNISHGLQLKAGAERKRRRLLKSAAVVGTTCCSTLLPQMDDLAFDICMLDEAGQITEPLSLMVLSRSKAR